MNPTIEKIRKYQLAMGWTSAYISGLIGVDPSTYSNHVNGRHKPYPHKMRPYQDYYDANKNNIMATLM